MSRELDFLAREAIRGRITRREFVGRAAAFGLALPAVTKLLSSTAMAENAAKRAAIWFAGWSAANPPTASILHSS